MPALICCAPVGIIVMWVAAPWEKTAKWAITGVLTVLFVASMVAGALAPPEPEGRVALEMASSDRQEQTTTTEFTGTTVRTSTT